MAKIYERLYSELPIKELGNIKKREISYDDLLKFDSISELNTIYRIPNSSMHFITKSIKYGVKMYSLFSLDTKDEINFNSIICKLTIEEFLKEYSMIY